MTRFLFIFTFLIIQLIAGATSLFGQKNANLRDYLQYPDNLLNDVWGYVDSLGKEYALVGTTTGFSIVDVSNPDSIFERHFIPGDTTIWRDIKTWEDHAFVVNEKGSGLLVVDLSQLPDSIDYYNWTGDSSEYQSAHNLFIDSTGTAYLFGHNISNRGALFVDVTDPNAPLITGMYDERYLHDGMVQGDTLYGAEIFQGEFCIVDVQDKANPIVLARQLTPNRFTHNIWVSQNGKYVFTTDEKADSYVASYDISNVNNIVELDQYQTHPGSESIPHNTHFFNNFLINSYYRNGITIVDATKADNLIETGNYDTSPFSPGEGFEGCWGAYPYLPSQNILATDRQEGLFVIAPQYKRAGYIEGKVTELDAVSPISNINIQIIGTDINKKTNIIGDYRTGVADSGNYDIRFYHPNCFTKIISGVLIQPAQTTSLNVSLDCDFPAMNIENLEDKHWHLRASSTLFHSNTTIQFQVFDLSNSNSTISIYNATGDLLKRFEFQTRKGEINFGHSLPSGHYVVKLDNNNEQFHLKLLKIR